MTKSQLEKLLGVTLDEGKDTYTDDEALELITKSHNELKNDRDKNKNLLSQRNSEIAELKKEKQDRMTDDEKEKQRVADLENKVSNYEKLFAKSNKVNEYMGIGYPKELAEKIADAELEGKSTANFHKEFITSREESIKAELLKGTGKVHTNDNDNTVTKEDYSKMTYSQKMALKDSNPELFEELSKKN